MKRMYLIASAILHLSFVTGTASAADGTIAYYSGDVSVIRGAAELSVDFGMELGAGDIVETGIDGVAILDLAGGSQIKLRGGTILALDSLGGSTSVTLRSGGIFSKVVKRPDSTYEVRTPSVAAGVRGTEFFVSYGKTIGEAPDIWLCVNEGSVEVALLGTDRTVVVEEGKGISIIAGAKLTKPRFYPWTRRLNWNTDPSGGEVADRTDLNQAYSDLLDQDYD